MKKAILAMTQRQRDEIHHVLFPGDNLETAAVLLCNQGDGKSFKRLIVAEILTLPHQRFVRKKNHIVWPVVEFFTPEKITEIDQKKLSIVTIHSHPEGANYFSAVDDTTDQELFHSIHNWFDDGRPLGSAIMLPNGAIRGRTIDALGKFSEMASVSIVGDEIFLYKPDTQIYQEDYELKLLQTFGKGTLKILKSMRVGVAGCSGTGSIVIELLSRSCVGELVIIDNDVVEIKNLNRIINSNDSAAKDKTPKVHVLKNAIEATGMGTKVYDYKHLTDHTQAVKALIDCDVIFGAVDSASGRYHLDCIASAYFIPYFDIGVNLEVDQKGKILAADAVAHYVRPDGSSLLSRHGYSMEQVTAEIYYRNDPDFYDKNRMAGYLAEVGEDQPAVISVNMQAACMAFNDFLARIHFFRLDENSAFATQKFRLVHGHYEIELDNGVPHPLLKKYAGTGDNSMLVQNNICHA